MLFGTFERFVNQLGFNLKRFSLKIRMEDENFLNAHRWERFILQYLPKLEEFSMRYIIAFQNDHQPSLYSGKPNEFFSPFWLQRQLDIRN